MRKWTIIGIGCVSILFLAAFTSSPKENSLANLDLSDEITAIINKDTSEKELEDLQKFFSENKIELIINNAEFNDNKEIIGLSIVLKKGKSKSQYSSKSQVPISEIELGYKNGSLFINNSGMSNAMSWNRSSSFGNSHATIDSIMKNQNFIFNFDVDEERDSLFFNGHVDIQKLKEQIMKSFSFVEEDGSKFIFNGKQVYPFQNHSKKYRYQFTDSPDIEKLIIIDGKESDFKTLDSLAKSDQLEEVDFLKPKTAISIYGKKAKDGAIIATTKK